MATFLELWKERDSLFTAIKQSCLLADENRRKEYQAVIKIQSWFRGCRVRAYINFLHECAIIIQAAYKGHYYRNKYKQKLKEYYELQRQNFCDRMATMIQSLWRGYYVRRYIHNYYSQKRYLESLVLKNESVRQQLTEQCEIKLEQQLKREEELEKLRRLQEARKYHYMLSTESTPGVFNSVSFEDEMKAIRYFDSNSKRTAPQQETMETKNVHVMPSQLTTIDLSASTGDCRIRHTPLPPIKEKGPFRSPFDVQKQRRRPLRPSLRVATPYDSIEGARMQLKMTEERKIVVEDRFLPFSKAHQMKSAPLPPTQAPYTNSDYGSKCFRNTVCDDHMQVKKRFNTIVSPIPVFEELNATY